MPNAHEKVPSAWRIIRAHLAVRESSTFKDIYAAVKEHRPNYQQKRFENKLTHMRRMGLITNPMKLDVNGDPAGLQRGVYKLTQDGRRDISDPEEAHGIATPSKAAQKAAKQAKAQRHGGHDGTNIAKARAKIKEMRANGTLVYKKKPGRPSKQQAEAKQRSSWPSSWRSSGQPSPPSRQRSSSHAHRRSPSPATPTPVDAELIERLWPTASGRWAPSAPTPSRRSPCPSAPTSASGLADRGAGVTKRHLRVISVTCALAGIALMYWTAYLEKFMPPDKLHWANFANFVVISLLAVASAVAGANSVED